MEDSQGSPSSSNSWWLDPVEFVSHVVIGVAIFLVIAGAAVGLDLLIRWLSARSVSIFILSGLKIAEYVLFGTDLILFVIFVLRTAWRIGNKL